MIEVTLRASEAIQKNEGHHQKKKKITSTYIVYTLVMKGNLETSLATLATKSREAGGRKSS